MALWNFCWQNSVKQASRAQILDKATEYIQYMRRKNHTHQQDIDDLKKQNALLEQQGKCRSCHWCLFMMWCSLSVTICSIWWVVFTAVFFYFLSFCLWIPQFVHWRRPRGTLSSRQTTLLTAACTQTVKAARCPPSTAGPTPALNQSLMSRPTERSCAWSPARLGSRPPAPPPRFPKQTLFAHQAQLLLLPVRTQSCLLTPIQETRWRLCERGAIMYKTLLPSFFSPGKHPLTPFVAQQQLWRSPQSEAALQFWRTLCFSNLMITIHNQMWR